MNHLVEKLNNLVEEVESGEAAVSIVSSYVSDVSQSINLHDEENWTLLRRELENCGLSSSILAEQREFISKWIINANEARRRQPDSHVPEVEATGNESVVALSDLIEQTVLAPEAKVPNMARRRKPDSHVPEAEATSNESVVAFSDSVEQTILAPEPKASDTAKTGRVNPSLMRRVRYGIFRRKNDLHRAVDKGDLAMVRELLTFKIPINAKNKYGRSAVRIAALKGDVEMMKLLLDQDASAFEDNQKPYCINEAMEISIRSCNWEAVEALLARGSSYRFGLFEIANAIGNVSTQTLRKMKESRSSGPTDEAIDKLVVPAATTGNIKALQLLLEEGADINAKSNNYAIADLSALHFAAANCNTTVMKLLLDNGADFEARDASGETPIHKIPCARDGIGMNYIDRNGTRIPYRISSCEPNKALHPWLRYTLYMRSNKTFQFSEIYDEDSTSLCDPNIALQLLLDSGADLNTKNYDGQTVVHLSAKYNEDSVLAALIEKGMNIEVIDNKGNTALHLAISAEYIRMQAYEERQWDAETKTPVTRWNKKVVLRLLKSKANANARNFDGKTPLHLACKYEHGKAAELLLEHGADVNIVDHRNWTALHHAVHNGSMSTVLVLLRYGASTSIRCLQDYGSKKTALEMAKLKGLDAIAQVLESVSTEN
jgi:ankyrin repeat protein